MGSRRVVALSWLLEGNNDVKSNTDNATSILLLENMRLLLIWKLANKAQKKMMITETAAEKVGCSFGITTAFNQGVRIPPGLEVVSKCG